MNLTPLQIGFALLFGFAPGFLMGQEERLSREISVWFLEERFIIADRNDDALLSRNEMQRFANEFVYFLVARHYSLTDRNQDGYLSFNEIYTRKHSEFLYRYNMERRQLRTLLQTYSWLENADAAMLKSYPALVEQLFGNLVWMSEHAQIAEQIYKDQNWLQAHPQINLALHQNLRWMAANPAEAKNLYRDRQATSELPELLGWRSDHKNFIRKNPKLTRFYELEFIPEGIRLRR